MRCFLRLHENQNNTPNMEWAAEWVGSAQLACEACPYPDTHKITGSKVTQACPNLCGGYSEANSSKGSCGLS